MRSDPRSHPHLSGFTLLELLTVTAIVALLAGLLFPVFAGAKRGAQRTACASNMKQTATAIVLYTNDHDDRLYPLTVNTWFDWRKAHRPYLKSDDILRCPGDALRDSFQCPGATSLFDCFGSSYRPTSAADTLDDLYERGLMLPLLSDPTNAHRADPFTAEPVERWRSNLAFPDTSVRYLHPTYGATY